MEDLIRSLSFGEYDHSGEIVDIAVPRCPTLQARRHQWPESSNITKGDVSLIVLEIADGVAR